MNLLVEGKTFILLPLRQQIRPVGRGGAIGASAPPPQATEVHFFVDQQFDRLELSTLRKDHDDQPC